MPTLVSHGGGTGANDGRPTTDIQEITMQYAGLQRTGTADARLIIDADGAANGTAHEISRFVNTSTGATSSYFYIGSTSGTDWRLGKNILGASGGSNFEIATHSGTTKALEINSSNLLSTFAGAGQFDTSLKINAPDGGGAPAMTAVLNMHGYEGRGVGIKIRDSVNSASGASNREWFIGSGYSSSGFNIGYASDGSSSSYPAQAKLSITTAGNATFDGDITVQNGDSTHNSAITIKGYEPRLNITKTRGSSGDDHFRISHENDASAVDFSLSQNGGGYVRTARITSNNRWVIGGYDEVNSAQLSVQGSFGTTGDVTATGNTRKIKLQNTSGNTALQLLSDSSGDGQLRVNDSGGTTKIFFYGEVNQDNYINNGGNLGIGTNSPTGYKVVVHNASEDLLKLHNTTDGLDSLISFTNPGGTLGRIQGIDNGGLGFDTGNNAGGINTNAMFIDNSGKVGIGNTAPTRQLHLKRTSGDVRGIMVETTSANSYAEVQVKAASEFRMGTGGSGTSVANQFYVYDATNGAHRFDIAANGYVGIGNTSPDRPLHVKSNSDSPIMLSLIHI